MLMDRQMYNGKPDPYIVPCLKAKAGGTKKQMTEFMSAKLRKKKFLESFCKLRIQTLKGKHIKNFMLNSTEHGIFPTHKC